MPIAEWVDPDDAPIMTKEDFERADFYRGGKLIRRGRQPTHAEAMEVVEEIMREDHDILAELAKR